MTQMAKQISQFLIFFGILLILSYLLHAGLVTDFFEMESPRMLDFSYKFNFGITFLFSTTIILLSKRFKDQLGYIFLVGSAVKLVGFIIVTQLRGFQIDKEVFLDFFIPYFVCVVLEIYFVAKLLNNTE